MKLTTTLITLITLLPISGALAFAQAAHSIGPMTWTWIQGANTDTPAGFHIWRSISTSGACAAMGTVPYATINSLTTMTYTDTSVVPGTTYCYVVTAFASTTDSAPTNEVSCGPVPFQLTAPTGLQPGPVK
jgi:hypothetical protein